MYKVHNPSGIIETESHKEAVEYQNRGFHVEKQPEEFDLEEVFGEQTDCMGMCFSDADPGL